jgi:hypothetical protein
MIHTVTSNSDQQESTILEIDSTTARMTVKLRIQNQQPQSILNAKLNTLFSLNFTKYDLLNNRMFWGFVVYSVDQSTLDVSSDGAGGVLLKYAAVNATITVPPRPPSLPAQVQNLSTTPVPEPIQVTVRINPAGSPLNFGWINMDIEHTYPALLDSGNGAFGWEPTLVYPILQFEESGLNSLTPPLQFAAVYKSNAVGGINSVSGAAVHIDDQRGNRKRTGFNQPTSRLSFDLQNPIHLKADAFAGNPLYVRPDRYKLSAFDSRGSTDFGYGGNTMMYRIRAFKIDGATVGSPADWHDVLNIYRRWLKVRKPTFYSKLIQGRPPNSPVDNMSPFTTVANYGLEGPIDPPPSQPAPRFPDLHKWLELHPIKKGEPDMSGNKNDSLLDLLVRMKQKFAVAGLKLEAQLWGWEMAGFFRYAGAFPPVTNVLSADSTKFKRAMKELADKGILISITTDPLAELFNRYRFRGHLIWTGTLARWVDILDPTKWVEAIPYSFPAKMKAATCAATDVTINGKPYNRIWIVRPFGGITPNCSEAVRIEKSRKLDAYGVLVTGSPALGTGLYRATGNGICPTQDLEDLYLNNWLRNGVFAFGARLLEFMKHSFDGFCYNKYHQHIVQGRPTIPPTPQPIQPLDPNAPFDNVIGVGSWYVKRCQSMLNGVQTFGQELDPNNSFSLTNEHTPLEAMVPYIDEYYPNHEHFHYVYSDLLTPKMTLGRDFAIHPGYKERRQKVNNLPPINYARPDHFLHLDRDREAIPVDPAVRATSFTTWQQQCVAYFKKYFEVANYGIAPKYYPTVDPPTPTPRLKPPVEGDPLPDTYPPTYTYNRCIQDVFNLRHAIFEIGARAVVGERIIVPSVWFESSYGYDQPYPFFDYNEEAINMAVRAVWLQTTFKDFFRGGFMLGEEAIWSLLLPGPEEMVGNRILWTWSNGLLGVRDFKDVKILFDRIALDDTVFGGEWQQKGLLDFLSKGIDKENQSGIATYFQIQHRVWQRGEGATRRVLYVFANLANGGVNVRFNYGRGLEGVSPNSGWKKTITRFTDAITSEPPANVHLGLAEDLAMPPRSFAAIEIKKP